ncbi:MFS transporter [Alcaligenaceae bacterium CGII-47]|nr:MFS transporter [Alcaligenaceae bacterium CGII-47]
MDNEPLYAWWRLLSSLLLMTMGSAGMYSVTVILPHLQADFEITRSAASLPYTLTMIGFGLGGVLMGRLADRVGIIIPLAIGSLGCGAGFILAGLSSGYLQFILAQSVLIGTLGAAATFAPLVADTTRWFTRRRGFALAICMSGNYFSGALWPPVMQRLIEQSGWRTMYIYMGILCLLVCLPLLWMYRRPAPTHNTTPGAVPQSPRKTRFRDEIARSNPENPLGMRPATLQALLCLAGVACCVAMAMPQVHIVAYCGDLGFGLARGAEMLSVMLAMGIISRLLSGWVSDHIGGLRTLLLGSALQSIALLMFLNASGLVSLYVVAALFGLFQGGIVPAYALIIREYFGPHEAGGRIGIVLMATLLGMALGGWLAGILYDLSGSYYAAFLNGIGWNLLNICIVLFLLMRARGWGRLQLKIG